MAQWLQGMAAWLGFKKRAEPSPEEEGPIGPGSIVGKYRLVRLLGEGAAAQVYLGERQGEVDPGEPSQAAVKLLLPEMNESDESRIRFEREIGMSMKLEHPRIIKTYDWGLADGRYWMAQTYLPGDTLHSWVKPSGMHPRDVKRVLVQLCEGLEHAHQRGVLHRDLKPENILLNAKGEPVIADFGLARDKMYATITQTKAALGTPAFMAPEQAQGDKVDGRADLYALGIIGYELLTGVLPFRGKPVAVLMAQIQQQPQPPRELQPTIAPEFEALILKLMSKQPQDRFASARQLIEALESL